MNKIANIKPTIKDVIPDLIGLHLNLVQLFSPLLQLMVFGKAPDLSNKAKSVAS